jgi:hypothetical protein
MTLSRAQTQRRSQSRKVAARTDQFTYAPPVTLGTPNLGPDIHTRWVRVSTNGQEDARNIHRRSTEGYRPVMIKDLPAESINPSFRGSQFGGAVGYHDTVLMQIPAYKAVARREWQAAQTQAKRSAIENDAFKDRHSSMPIAQGMSRVRMADGTMGFEANLVDEERVTTGRPVQFEE